MVVHSARRRVEGGPRYPKHKLPGEKGRHRQAAQDLTPSKVLERVYVGEELHSQSCNCYLRHASKITNKTTEHA